MADDPTTDDRGPDPSEPDLDPDGIWAESEVAGMPRQRAVRIAQVGLIALVVLIVGIVLLTQGGDDDSSGGGDQATEAGAGSDDATTTTAEPRATWPATVQGRPEGLGETKQPATEVMPTAAPGAYLWSDFDGWHLWVVNGEGMPAVTGTLTSNADVEKAVLAVPDAGQVTADGKTIQFSFPTDRPLVGMDFNPGFYANSLVVTIDGPDGAPIDVALVKTGKASTPAPFPIAIDKAVPEE